MDALDYFDLDAYEREMAERRKERKVVAQVRRLLLTKRVITKAEVDRIRLDADAVREMG